MTTTAPAFTSAQRQRAAALYRSLIRTTRELFQGDQRALLAAHQETRNRFLAAKNERDAAKIDENLDMGEQVNYLLKHNVVQGVSEPESGSTYKLRFTEHTELGSNDTIKHTRPAPTLSEIERTKANAVHLYGHSLQEGECLPQPEMTRVLFRVQCRGSQVLSSCRMVLRCA